MKKIDVILFFVAIAAGAVLMIAGCSKDNGGVMDDSPLSFRTHLPEIVQTKSDPLTTVTSFVTVGYDGETQWFPRSGVKGVSLSDGKAIFPDYIWENGSNKTFYAYTNLFQGGLVEGKTDSDGFFWANISKDRVTLDCQILPELAADQRDILLGRYSGTGGDVGTAEMTFFHPLAQVVFNVGEMEGVTAISKILINGVYRVGTTSLDMSTTTSEDAHVANFVWSNMTSTSYVWQEVSGPLPSSGSQVGIPFYLIPQNFADSPVIVALSVVVGGNTVEISKEIDSGAFETGKKTVCTLTVNPNRQLGCTLAAYTANNDDDIFLTSQPDNEIWYEASTKASFGTNYLHARPENGAKLLGEALGAGMFVEHVFENGKGRLIFDKAITTIPTNDKEGNNMMLFAEFQANKLMLPKTVTSLESNAIGIPGNHRDLGGPSIDEIYIDNNITNIATGAFHFFNKNSFKIIVGDSSPQTFTLDEYSFSPALKYGPGLVYEVTLYWGCFAKGTLITLADGTKKKVEDLTYSDKLRTWNFDEGKEDSANILWITKAGLKADYFFRCTLSDGTVLDLIGEEDEGTHRLFNKTAGKFEYPDQMAPGSKVYTEHGLVEVVSFERVDEEVEYYNLITDRDINCYINNVLSSCRYNNIYPIDDDMKFVKDGRKKRPYSEFKEAGISREWYNGLRLGEQTYDVSEVASYIERCETNMAQKPAPTFWQRIKTWWKSIFG